MKSWFVQTCLKHSDEDKPKHCNLASMLYDLAVGLRLEISTGLLYYLTWIFTMHGCRRLCQKSDNGPWKHVEGLQQKKEETCKIYYLLVTTITPDIRQIWQEKPDGKLKIASFCMKKSFQIRSQHSPTLCYKSEMGGNKPLFWQNYIEILSFWHVTPHMYRQCC